MPFDGERIWLDEAKWERWGALAGIAFVVLMVLATLTNDGDVAALTAKAAEHGKSAHFLLMDHETLPQDVAAMAPFVENGCLNDPAARAARSWLKSPV